MSLSEMFICRDAMSSVLVSLTLVSFLVSFFVFSSTSASGVDPPTKAQQSVRLSRVMDEIRRLSDLGRLLDLKVQQAVVGGGDGRGGPPMADLGSLEQQQQQKREASWDMDYGWGGGRFGKRMDTLGIAGRFGRSVHEDESGR